MNGIFAVFLVYEIYAEKKMFFFLSRILVFFIHSQWKCPEMEKQYDVKFLVRMDLHHCFSRAFLNCFGFSLEFFFARILFASKIFFWYSLALRRIKLLTLDAKILEKYTMKWVVRNVYDIIITLNSDDADVQMI